MSIFEQRNYKDFLRDKIRENRTTRGYQSLLATAAQCQRSYISRILNEDLDLSYEHAMGLAEFWELDGTETQYFLDLVAFARAGTPKLRAHLEGRLALARRERQSVSKRIEAQTSVTPDGGYYNAWHLSAIHVISTIKDFRRPEAIAKRLGIPLNLVEASLRTLQGMGLMAPNKGQWEATSPSPHLDRSSPYIWMHHQNWLQKALSDVAQANTGSVHYSAVHSLSKADLEKLKELLLNFIETTHRTVKPSPEEELLAMSLHLFVPS